MFELLEYLKSIQPQNLQASPSPSGSLSQKHHVSRQNCTVSGADLFLVFIHSEVVKNDYFGCFSIPSEDLSEAQYCKDHTVKVLCHVSCFFKPLF
jgi:hypothetical protein